jgi:hypothetical protein
MLERKDPEELIAEARRIQSRAHDHEVYESALRSANIRPGSSVDNWDLHPALLPWNCWQKLNSMPHWPSLSS